MYEEILYEVTDPVATITLNRPDKLNALTNRTLAELHHAVADAEVREDVDCRTAEGEFPARTDATHPFVEVVRSTAREVYGQEPVTTPNAPSTQPLYPMMKLLDIPMVSAGISNPDGRAHAPDENIRIADFISGTKHVAAIIERLGQG